jgi:hypothetical protein
MTVRRLFHSSVVAACAALAVLAAVPRLTAQIQVVDMMPQAMSDEAGTNGEPFLAVNPANLQSLAASAFMPTPMGSPNGPLLVSTDGGSTWVARNIIPSQAGFYLNTGDITIRFNSAGTALYAGIIRATSANLEVIRTTDMTLTTPMEVLESRFWPDQPYLAARTVTGWYDPGKDRVWVGNNDSSNSPQSATIDQSLDGLAALPAFTQIRIDGGMPSVRDNYQVRPVASPDGHVYAAFYRRTGAVAGGYNADVVVVREDNWGKTVPPFQALGAVGVNVVSGAPITDDFSGAFGHEIIGGDLFLTVDPNDASRLYISWAQQTGMDQMTLHVSRSTDFGQTWSADLIAVPSAKNAALAVNSAGRLGYFYQQLTGTVGSRHWQTHLRRSDDGMIWSDVTLSDFPAEGAGSSSDYRIIGDYANLVAVGKNFYGVFSAENDLVNASFPAGVTFLRNKTPDGDMSPHFLGVDGVTAVNPSIDPFFFRTSEIDPAADVYVRDWTDDGATHDQGQEPSVRNDFYSTSDVWNERTDDPLPFDATDRPQVHDPQPAAMGHNYAFARVSREATGTPVDVTLQYYYADGGVGVPYVSAGAPIPRPLEAGDAARPVAAGGGLQWELPSGVSNHVCLAVEVSAPGDPVHGGTLLGHAPGWPTTDLLVVADNNKAQRNMQVFGFGGMSQGQWQAAAYAIVRNAADRARDMQIGLDADPRGLDALGGAVVQVLGGRQGTEPQRVVPGGVVTLPAMAPGESRWLEVRFAPTERLTAPLPIKIHELVDGRAVNGYAFVPTPRPLPDAVYDTLFQYEAVAVRLGDAFGSRSAAGQAARAKELLAGGRMDPDVYARFIAGEATAIQAMTAELLAAGRQLGDPFGAAAAADLLARAGSSGTDPTATQVLHLTLLNKLDATATYYQKGGGRGR